jgi:predicted SAM-dependent methyltransferase
MEKISGGEDHTVWPGFIPIYVYGMQLYIYDRKVGDDDGNSHDNTLIMVIAAMMVAGMKMMFVEISLINDDDQQLRYISGLPLLRG